MPKISVILTSFNHEIYVARAIESVLSQTYQDFELIIYDDFSSDGSWDVIQQYVGDPRVRCFRSSKNERGLINKGVAAASGEFVAIHHSDDLWERDKLRQQIAALEARPDAGMVCTWVQFINENDTFLENDWFNVSGRNRAQWARAFLNGENKINHPSVLIRKKVYEEVGGYTRIFYQLPDAEMWCRVISRYEILTLEEKLTLHRRYSDERSTSGSRPDVFVRSSNELFVMVSSLLHLPVKIMLDAFPSLDAFRNVPTSEQDSEFLLCWAAYHDGALTVSTRAFGLLRLYEIMRDPQRRSRIEKTYRFDLWQLIRLSGNLDAFNTFACIALREEVETGLDRVRLAEEQVRALENELRDLLSSRSWRYTEFIRASSGVLKRIRTGWRGKMKL